MMKIKLKLIFVIFLFLIACSSKKNTIYSVMRDDWTGKSYYDFQILKDSMNYRITRYNYNLDSLFNPTAKTRSEIVKDRFERDTVFLGSIKIVKNLKEKDCWEFPKKIFFNDLYIGCVEQILKDTSIHNIKIKEGYIYKIAAKDPFHADDEVTQRIFFDRNKNIIIRREGLTKTGRLVMSEQVIEAIIN